MNDARAAAEALAAELGGGIVKAGRGWNVRCPCHDDRTPSLNLVDGDIQPILVRCYAGCTQSAVITELARRGLWPGIDPDTRWRPQPNRGASTKHPKARLHPITPGKLVAVYDYTDEEGELLYQVLRYEPKSFAQRRPALSGALPWVYNLDGARRVLYHLPEVLRSERVMICEGEKDVEVLRAFGLCATCNSGGAGKWLDEFNELFKGKHVDVLADNDGPGKAHAEHILRSLYEFAAGLSIITFDPEHKDVSEWLADGHDVSELFETERSNAA
jgi:putative DNA primase/helicase